MGGSDIHQESYSLIVHTYIHTYIYIYIYIYFIFSFICLSILFLFVFIYMFIFKFMFMSIYRHITTYPEIRPPGLVVSGIGHSSRFGQSNFRVRMV